MNYVKSNNPVLRTQLSSLSKEINEWGMLLTEYIMYRSQYQYFILYGSQKGYQNWYSEWNCIRLSRWLITLNLPMDTSHWICQKICTRSWKWSGCLKHCPSIPSTILNRSETWRPITTHDISSNNIFYRKGSPDVGITAVVAVVTQHKNMSSGHKS